MDAAHGLILAELQRTGIAKPFLTRRRTVD